MADDALVWLSQVCPWQATVWQRALASQQVAVQWQAEGTWQRSWSEMPRLWLLDVAATGEEVAVCCQWWRTHCPQVPLGLIDSRQSEVTAAQHSEVQRWGALGLLPGFDRAHITRSVAANLRQVLAWLGLGDFDKARLVPVLVSLATLHAPLTQVQPVPEQSQTHAQPAPSPPVVPSSDPVVRRYRGAVVLPSGASPPTPVVKLRYRGAEVVPPHPSPPEPVVTPSSDLPIPPPPPPKRRALLGGRYQVLYPLGVGGFCQTLLALDVQRLGHPQCVVKQLRPSHSDPEYLAIARRLFHAEAETLERLGQHPQIPRLLAYFEQGGEFYLVQEYIHGALLDEILIPGQPLSEQAVVQLLWELLEILEFVHGQGVIHRDIKPTNIIRRQEDNKLLTLPPPKGGEFLRSP